MGVDVLVVGHSHSLKMTETIDGGLIIDPGTATGAPVANSLEPKRYQVTISSHEIYSWLK